MIIIFTIYTVIIIISLAIVLLTLRLREKSLQEREKITPFECGFSPFKKARRSFSIRFFVVTLIFLIFDIEIALLFPLRVLITSPDKTILIIRGVVVIIILTAGLLHEWSKGALNWIKWRSNLKRIYNLQL